MDKRELETLLDRYEKGQCTPREIAALEKVLAVAAEDSVTDELEVDTNTFKQKWALAKQKTNAASRRARILRILPYAAASIVIAGSLFFFGDRYYGATKQQPQVTIIENVEPGRNQAYLTLGDGRKISLEEAKDGLLASQGSFSLYKTGNGQLKYVRPNDKAGINPMQTNTISTPRGGEFSVELPDGSRVWLNAASSITFSTDMATSATRELSIHGEVYFEVATDKSRPFRVKAGIQTVEVLGTHFSINSYADEPQVKTSLLEGSVRITSHTLATGVILRPGQQALLSQNKKIEIVPVNESALAWKNGLIRFRGADLHTVMRQLSRWYDLDVIYEGQISNELINATVPKTSQLATVLDLLRGIGVEFTIEQTATGKRIIVKGN
ncbi:FecR domain-containing protein [Chitinophaga horti]|uniref:FecR domain-containing protein n=1 Tax=Chitinophaga horti TaxID=2920382 RepID=A0ABY6IWL5_9BACT|nr:FecR family protein [Chitinophaga horti]UYQ91770.1 FecR domain-containing protein [Chitinophaga horti]